MLTAPTANGQTVTLPDIEATADVIWNFVIEHGQATRDEIREACKATGATTEVYQKSMAKLANQTKALTEVSREDGSKAYELKRHCRQFTYGTFLEMIAETAAPAKPREKYEGWYTLTGYFMLTSPCLSSRPVLGNPSARRFERDHEGNLLMPGGNFRAMFEEATGLPGVPDIGTARYRVVWDQMAVDPALLITILNPVPPSRPGMSGQGLTEIESLPAGTRIPFSATIPGSHVSPIQFAEVLAAAGRWAGFSPSARRQGWGRFRPEFDEPGFHDALALAEVKG